jgi:hypothetical protein
MGITVIMCSSMDTTQFRQDNANIVATMASLQYQ